MREHILDIEQNLIRMYLEDTYGYEVSDSDMGALDKECAQEASDPGGLLTRPWTLDSRPWIPYPMIPDPGFLIQ